MMTVRTPLFIYAILFSIIFNHWSAEGADHLVKLCLLWLKTP